MSGPLVFGVVFEHSGRGAAWSITAGLAFAASALMILGARPGRGTTPPQPSKQGEPGEVTAARSKGRTP
jgi:hypothetical protein